MLCCVQPAFSLVRHSNLDGAPSRPVCSAVSAKAVQVLYVNLLGKSSRAHRFFKCQFFTPINLLSIFRLVLSVQLRACTITVVQLENVYKEIFRVMNTFAF